MGKTKIDFNGVTKIVVNAAGDLKITGWEESGALISSEEDDEIRSSVNGEIATIDCDSDSLTLLIPQDITVQVVNCDSDLIIKNLHSKLEILQVGGDFNASEINGDLTTGNIGGDIFFEGISGNVILDSAGGDFSANKLMSDVQLGNIGGDLKIKQCSGNISAVAGGDASVYFLTSEERKVLLNAGGDILVHFDGDPSGHFSTVSGSGTTEVQLLDERQLKGSSVNKFELGTGLGSYKFVAGGDIHICNKDACHSKKNSSFQDFSGDPFRHLKIDIDGISEINMDEIQQRINEKLEKVHHKTEEINARIEEKMQRHFQKMREKGVIFDDHTQSKKDQAKTSDPVTEDEKKLILKMLQDKKISPEEAERLFESLEKNG